MDIFANDSTPVVAQERNMAKNKQTFQSNNQVSRTGRYQEAQGVGIQANGLQIEQIRPNNGYANVPSNKPPPSSNNIGDLRRRISEATNGTAGAMMNSDEFSGIGG